MPVPFSNSPSTKKNFFIVPTIKKKKCKETGVANKGKANGIS